jgi:hypothetical protein
MPFKLMLFVLFLFAIVSLMSQADYQQRFDGLMIDDFEAYADHGLPTRWKYIEDRNLVWVKPHHMRPDEEFFVVEEQGNKFLRAYTNGEAVHLTMANEAEGFNWDLRTHPILSWEWRANRLPKGAREDQPNLNDAGLGLYVFFDFRGLIFKRPVGIKYTYSSTLPVGTILKQDKLRVIVVANGERDFGRWIRIQRNVLNDYRQAFDEEPPDRPLSIRLWSDSDNTEQIGEGDFDNIMLLQQ